MRTLILMILLLSFVAASAGCDSDSVTQLDPESATEYEVKLKPCAVHTVALESNASTGYQWQADFGDMLELVSEDYESSSKLVGAPGRQLFTFRALTTGTTTITFRYLRPWEETALHTITVTVVVK